ncbi:hypothetical protein HBI12_037600 [Parastagonospora nodorum]|nr:hypothetical protein HBI12_037600 [Parastagonospora nodorum]KAH6230102.1 hypothetical protein HBI43_043990 [Parastagonospora nodorum]
MGRAYRYFIIINTITQSLSHINPNRTPTSLHKMKLITLIATFIAVTAAVAVPAELQERQCIFNGLGCDVVNNRCCSGNCESYICGGRTFTCQPKDVGCSPPVPGS